MFKVWKDEQKVLRLQNVSATGWLHDPDRSHLLMPVMPTVSIKEYIQN